MQCISAPAPTVIVVRIINCIYLQANLAAAWVKKVGRAAICDFPTDSCKFPTRNLLVGAQNLSFVSKFPYFAKMGDLVVRILYFSAKIC